MNVYQLILISTGLVLVLFLVLTWLIIKNRVNKKTEKIQKSLGEKDILLREIHHRVKNNLSIISGLIELQLHNTDNAEARRVLKDSQSRIHSMAMIHDKLYQTHSLSEISLDNYIKDLVETIHRTFSNQHPVILKFDMEEVHVNIDKIIPCGLLINELVVNAFKHAFKNTGGILSVSLKKNKNRVEIIVSDNGPGIPEGAETGKDSLGLMLINTFAAQLKAQTELTADDGGTSFTIRFPLH